MEDAGSSLIEMPVQEEIKIYMRKAVDHFARNGLITSRAPMDDFQKSLEIGLATFFSIEDVPLILKNPDDPKEQDSLWPEMAKCMVGQSKYTFAGLLFVMLIQTNGFIAKSKVEDYVQKCAELKEELMVSRVE